MSHAQIMQFGRLNRIATSSLMLALASLILSPSTILKAGEPIVFGGAKPKVEPGKEKVPSQNPFGFEKLSAPGPLDISSLTIPVLPSLNSNGRKDKRQQNAEEENKNWMFLEKGELQEKDDEKNFLGIKDNDVEDFDFDKSKDRKDYTFREGSRMPSQTRVPGTLRKPETANQARPVRDNREDDSDSRRPRSSAIVFGNGRSQVGSSEVGFQSMVGTRPSEQTGDKASFSLRDFISTPAATPSREQQTRSDNFRQFLRSSSPLSAIADSASTAPDPTMRQSLNPLGPSMIGNPLSKGMGTELPSLRPSSLQPNNSSWNLASPDLSPRPSSGLSPQSSPSAWKPTEVQWPKRF